MAQDGPLAQCQHGRHPVTTHAQASPPHRVHAAVHSKQTSALDALVHRAASQPELGELRSLHGAVLAVSQLRDAEIA